MRRRLRAGEKRARMSSLREEEENQRGPRSVRHEKDNSLMSVVAVVRDLSVVVAHAEVELSEVDLLSSSSEAHGGLLVGADPVEIARSAPPNLSRRARRREMRTRHEKSVAI